MLHRLNNTIRSSRRLTLSSVVFISILVTEIGMFNFHWGVQIAQDLFKSSQTSSQASQK
ncbi:MAG: hypothetical protein N4J56_005642 [Chroococcidiopsis sp. SAG 2025]|uniref:hypothetical protein n=1 Tax=Chroococcidiopsis sp. SAG 2025 TaxID=171389 RepID=UPI0029371E14|nr:hypothetical protein [Chroococcidiopsis sp. SAG 2025]MDV2995988.1 hypothetical protein [Chroococcidiopsis sp. SAG 2025]